MNDTYVTVVGNLTADPVRRATRTGDPMVTFRVASTPRRRTPDGSYEDGPTSFYDVSAYRSLARGIAASLAKGSPVVVHGRQRIVSWTSGDRSGRSVEIDAASVGLDLARCVVTGVDRHPGRRDQADERSVRAAFDGIVERYGSGADTTADTTGGASGDATGGASDDPWSRPAPDGEAGRGPGERAGQGQGGPATAADEGCAQEPTDEPSDDEVVAAGRGLGLVEGS